MKMRFHGACGVVTGSMTELMDEKLGVHFLVDCGAQQGVDTPLETRGNFDFEPKDIQFVLLTHAHADHCGRLPELVRRGFAGPVYCTEATSKLAQVSLLDAARQEGSRFCREDVEAIQWKTWKREPYEKPQPVHQDVFVQAHRSSHLLGAVSWSINWGPQRKHNPVVIFSGDVGPHHEKEDGLGGLISNNQPPHAFAQSGHTTLVLESTYGARQTPPATRAQRQERLLELLLETASTGGKLLIPAFALGRVQEVLLDLHVLKYRTHVKQLESLQIFTPGHGMAYEASQIYAEHLFQTVARHMYAKDEVRLIWANRRMFQELGFVLEEMEGMEAAQTMVRQAFGLEGGVCHTVRSSADFVQSRGPGVFVAPSGMGDAGMMASALKALVDQENTTVALVGYAAKGTAVARMRDMLSLSANDRARKDEQLWPDATLTSSQLRARLVEVQGYGGHAHAPTLWGYLAPKEVKEGEHQRFKPVDAVYLVHGDEHARRDLAGFFYDQREGTEPSWVLGLPKQLEWIELETARGREIAERVESLHVQLCELSELDWGAVERLLSAFRRAPKPVPSPSETIQEG
jgi:metallo-beta-lactamase family protein